MKRGCWKIVFLSLFCTYESRLIVKTEIMTDAEDRFLNDKPVQPLSINWIDVKTIRKLNNFSDIEQISDIVDLIVTNYNSTSEEADFKIDYENYDLKGYSVRSFSNRNRRLSQLAVSTQKDPKHDETSNFIIFFFKTSSDRIISLNSGSGFEVVREFCDHSYPLEIAEKVADPKTITQLKRRCLFGQNTSETLIGLSLFELYKTGKMYYLIEEFQCDLKENSSLFSVINRAETEVGRCWINVSRAGSLRIGRSIALKNYPEILNQLDKYITGEVMEDADPLFEFLHFVKPALKCKEELDTILMKQIFSRWSNQEELLVDILHTRLQDFLSSNSFVIKIDGYPADKMQKPPTMMQILRNIFVIKPENEDHFLQTMSKVELGFEDQTKNKHIEFITDLLEGSIVVGGEQYFKIRKKWYIIDADHFGLLCEDVKNVIKNHLIQTNEREGQLPHPWMRRYENNSHEKLYNQTYSIESNINCENYLVFDTITPLGIEPCDILKYTDTKVYLYHVKKNFGDNTRIVSSQILNSAALFRDFLSSRGPYEYIEKLWKQATQESFKDWEKCRRRRMIALGKDGFYDILRSRKIVFVYAYLPQQDKSFSSWLTKNRTPLEQIEIDKLIEAGYMNKYQRLTGKFYCETQEQFVKNLPGLYEGFNKAEKKVALYQKLQQVQFSESTIGMFELVKLADNLRELDFEFKICEINRHEDRKSLPNEGLKRPHSLSPEQQNGNQSTSGESSTAKRQT